MPEPVNTSVTPNGMRLEFYEKPWRAYTINGEFNHPWTTDEPYGRVPSVTAILGTLDKSGPLVGWAVNVTCQAAWVMGSDVSSPTIVGPLTYALRAEASGLLAKKRVTSKDRDIATALQRRADRIDTEGYSMPSSWRMFQRDMRRIGIDHNSVTKEAQLRGSAVHLIGENWVNEGKFPNLADYPQEWRGYVRAIAKFLSKHGDGLKVAEQIVGSAKHGYAGTCDTVAVATFGDSTVRIDFKTSKQTYARTHFRQLAAYELAAVEGGEDGTDRQAIAVLGSDGDFTMSFVDEVEWPTSPQQSFLDVLKVYRDEQPLKKHEEATYRARREREKKRAS